MDWRELDKLSGAEYIRQIHKLPWEEFIAESVRKNATGYVLALYEKALETKAKTIVELGVMFGESTRSLLKAATENDGHLYSVELTSNIFLIGEILKSEGADMPSWTPICGDDLEVAKQWTVHMDFLFIDTSHTCEQTFKELEAYAKFVVPQGIIVMHDTYMVGTIGTCSRWVKDAINDFMKLHSEWVFEDITPPNDGWGLGLLRRKQ